MKKILSITIILITLFTITSCTKSETKSKLDLIIEKNNYIIVDVRTKEEYNESHVKSSINIPYDEIDEKTTLDKNKTIIVYCRSGDRSSKAYNTLKELGYDVYDAGAFDKLNLEKE